MIRGFYSAGSGLVSCQTGIDSIANNIANVNTAGYKKQSVRFSDLMTSNLASPDGANPQNMKVGNGTAVSGSLSLHTQGTTQFTGGEFDFALSSPGFFGIIGQDGIIRYTRDGSFHLSSEETGNYLVNSEGGYVVGRDGNKILLQGETPNEIGVFNFANPCGLSNTGGNLFETTPVSGEPYLTEGTVLGGCLELSNVDLSDEMASLITMQKAFQFNAKILQTADEIEGIINNLR